MSTVTVIIDGKKVELDADGLEFLSLCMRMSPEERMEMGEFMKKLEDKEKRRNFLKVIQGGKEE